MAEAVLIIDGTCAMAGAMDMNRNLTAPLEEARGATRIHDVRLGWPDAEMTCTLPEMRRARMAVAVPKVLGCMHHQTQPHGRHRTRNHCYAAAHGHLAYYRILAKTGEAHIITNRAELASHLREWTSASDRTTLPVGFIVGMEGADPILWPEQVFEWWEDGIRMVSLCHAGINAYAHGEACGVNGGLFPPARELLRHMEALGMILDVTHSSDRSLAESLDSFGGPVVATHHACRTLVPGERQLPDYLLTLIVERGAVVGVPMHADMLHRGVQINWLEGAGNAPIRERFPRDGVSLEDFCDHVDHICQLAGDSTHAGIGGDTDGQGGRPGAPSGVESVVAVLENRGYARADIDNVMHMNWQRLFERCLPAGDSL